jgi:hypothetical protein
MNAAAERRKRFEEIFSNHEWGGGSRSGPGSDPSHTRPFVDFCHSWLSAHPDIKTVVEVGCGDWATSSLIDFADRSYIGIDIVEPLISENQRKYGSSRVSFQTLDFVDDELPTADLLIAKDVLQHLSNSCVLSFLDRNKDKFNYALLVNDAEKLSLKKRWFFETRRAIDFANRDILDGESRPLLLNRAPFNLRAGEQKRYNVVVRGPPDALIYTKEILVYNGRSL